MNSENIIFLLHFKKTECFTHQFEIFFFLIETHTIPINLISINKCRKIEILLLKWNKSCITISAVLENSINTALTAVLLKDCIRK